MTDPPEGYDRDAIEGATVTARPVEVMARPVEAVRRVVDRRGRVGAWVDVAWVLGVMAVYVGLIEGILAVAVVGINPGEPMDFPVLLGAMALRLALVAGLLRWRLAVRGQAPEAIGLSLRRGWLELAWGVPTAGAALMTAMMISLVLLLVMPSLQDAMVANRKAGLGMFPSMTPAGRVALAAMAALVEEVLLRGYVLSRLRAALPTAWVAIALQAAIFALPHGYQGPTAMVAIFGVGVVFGVATWWRGSIVAAVVGHTLFNTIQFTLVDVLTRRGLL